jgi:DNA mismatch repair protein MutS2
MTRSGLSAQHEAAMTQALDLLCSIPECRVNTQLLRRALAFAFSSGDTDRAFEKVLESATAPKSSYKPSNFEADLFLKDFTHSCFARRPSLFGLLPSEAYVQRVLSHPPLSLDVTRARQEAIRWLTSAPEHSEALIALHRSLCEFRELLSAADFSTRIDPNQRRLDILRTFLKVVEQMRGPFAQAGTLLARVQTFADSVADSEAFNQLRQFLHFERSATRLDVRVHLGLDGAVRDFEISRYETEELPPLGGSRILRVFRSLGLLLRGVRLSEQELLSRVLFAHFEALRDLFLPLFQLIGDAEFYLTAISFVEACQQANTPYCFPKILEQDATPCSLNDLTNPFLVLEQLAVRSTSIALNADAIVIVTGPNSGGKTRLMQSVAFAQLLGQNGFPISASSATLRRAGNLFVSMLQDVRADQREGRLGTELQRIRHLFEQVRPGDLVILDELCSGTNPSEGEEIFQLVLQLLAELDVQVWLSTHFLRFAGQLQDNPTPKLQFLRVQLDSAEQPLFCFEPGVAYTSLAKQTAARLGVTLEELTRLVNLSRKHGPRVSEY